MSNRIAPNDNRRHGEHGRLGRRGAAVLLSVIGLIGLLPAMSPATPTFKIRIVDLSSPLASTGEDYTLRTDVVTTCAPTMEGGIGSCGTIEVTVSWWTDATSPKLVETNVMMVGGPLSFRIPAADVKVPRLHYRIVASQVWTRAECLYLDNCRKEQTASVTIFGSTQVT